MEITWRSLWTLIHGMGFGVLYLMACSGALVELYRRFIARSPSLGPSNSSFLTVYLLVMSALAWLAVLTGTYIVYPWYRATPPAGTVDLSGFPQKLLMSRPTTIEWHSMGMEWKEHVAWLVPILATSVALLVTKHYRLIAADKFLRKSIMSLFLFAFLAASIAGVFGAFINKAAPLR